MFSNSENTCTRPGVCAAPPHHGVDRALQGLRAAAGAVLDHHAEAAGIADAGDRRRRGDEDQAVLDRLQPLEQLALDRGGGLPRVLAPASRTESSVTKIAPAFGALVKVAPEKPTMFTAWAMPGTFSAIRPRAG